MSEVEKILCNFCNKKVNAGNFKIHQNRCEATQETNKDNVNPHQNNQSQNPQQNQIVESVQNIARQVNQEQNDQNEERKVEDAPVDRVDCPKCKRKVARLALVMHETKCKGISKEELDKIRQEKEDNQEVRCNTCNETYVRKNQSLHYCPVIPCQFCKQHIITKNYDDHMQKCMNQEEKKFLPKPGTNKLDERIQELMREQEKEQVKKIECFLCHKMIEEASANDHVNQCLVQQQQENEQYEDPYEEEYDQQYDQQQDENSVICDDCGTKISLEELDQHVIACGQQKEQQEQKNKKKDSQENYDKEEQIQKKEQQHQKNIMEQEYKEKKEKEIIRMEQEKNQQQQQGGDGSMGVCPICSKQFPTELLEIHVNHECIA